MRNLSRTAFRFVLVAILLASGAIAQGGDIHNIRSVKFIIANGVMYPTAKLWESVGFRP